MPPEHLYEKGINEHDEGYYRSKASEIGPYTSRLIDAMFHRSKHPEQEYRSCAAVIYSIKKLNGSISGHLTNGTTSFMG